MAKTDYAEVSAVYDNNPGRRQQPFDDLIARCVGPSKRSVRVLDLACGTGNYIEAQRRYFSGSPVQFVGVDESAKMLTRAQQRNPAVDFLIGRVPHIPCASESFELVCCNYAFHHFEHKRAVIREVLRVLKPAGFFVVRNSSPELMNDSWVYRFFPAARTVDAERYWSNDRMYTEFRKHFHVSEMEIRITRSPYMYSPMIDRALNRDWSNLRLISESAYASGMKKLQRAAQRQPNWCDSSFATIRCLGIKH